MSLQSRDRLNFIQEAIWVRYSSTTTSAVSGPEPYAKMIWRALDQMARLLSQALRVPSACITAGRFTVRDRTRVVRADPSWCSLTVPRMLFRILPLRIRVHVMGCWSEEKNPDMPITRNCMCRCRLTGPMAIPLSSRIRKIRGIRNLKKKKHSAGL